MKKINSFKSLPSPLKIPSQNKPPLLCHLNVKISKSQRLSAENQFLDLLKNTHTMELTIQQFQECSFSPGTQGTALTRLPPLFISAPGKLLKLITHIIIETRCWGSTAPSAPHWSPVPGGDVTAFSWGKVRLWRGICPHSRQGSIACSKEFIVFTRQVSPPFPRSNHMLKLRAVRFHQFSFLLANAFFSFWRSNILVKKINVFITLPVIQWEDAFVLFVFSIFEEGGKRKWGLPSSTTGKNRGEL